MKNLENKTRQSEYFTTGCLLDYHYVKEPYRLVATDLSTQKKLYVDPKAMQQIEFVGQLEKVEDGDNATDAGYNDQTMFFLTILDPEKRN